MTLRLLSLALLLAFAGVFFASNRRAIDPGLEETYARDVRRAQAASSQLRELVVRARQGAIYDWDPLVHTIQTLERAHARLQHAPRFLSADGRAELENAVSLSKESLSRRISYVEELKSASSELRNSALYFPNGAAALANHVAAAPGGQTLALCIKELLAAVTLFELMPDDAARLTALVRAEDTAREAALLWPNIDDVETLTKLFQHVEIIQSNRPRVEAATSKLLAEIPADLDSVYTRHYHAALEASAARQRLLFVLALAAIAAITADVLRRQALNASRLRSLSMQLEQANVELRRERTRDQELADLKSRFVSMTSHEFRTPLSVIRSSAELLEAYWARWAEPKRTGHLRRIRGAAEIMNELLEGVLVIGRADAGKLELNPRPLDLSMFCADVIETMQQSAPGANIDYQPQDLGTVLADEALLRHILTNLISNAIKYSPKNAAVRVGARVQEGVARFEIADRGIGIPEGDQSRLFDSFHRGSNVGAIQGTGLGLAIVKRAVDRHGGRIEVESHEGEGTRFIITIPVGETT